VTFCRVETEELTGAGVDRFRRRLDPHLAADDEQQRRFRHLVFAQLLSGRELDEHDTALPVLRVEHGRRA